MKIATIIGARPQFIKAAMLSRKLRDEHDELLIHTGQHYDYNMSELFFSELSIPKPDYNLGISGGNHGKMTGAMLANLEDVFIDTKPDIVLVYGDTNSTLAGALAAVKLHIPVCHIEAGVRMHTLHNPEEVNRILTDRISTLLMCCTESSIAELAKEGITENVHFAGDLMYDATIYYQQRVNHMKHTLTNFDGNTVTLPQKFYYLTCHRQENTETDRPLFEILTAMNSLDYPTIYPVHPRTKERATRILSEYKFRNVLLVDPVGYLTSLWLVSEALKVVTDSGGLQREAWFLDKQCITILDHVVWPETMRGNVNQISAAESSEILAKLNVKPDFSKKGSPFGDGNAANKIVLLLSQYSTS
ncbi:MAG: UDP-N-acetylglucosamine 2-epimerase (non-hydrolyzing) [Oscillospiraceae bacterium]|nr:UDP-N-acetylglucosamine 2-epimerase (non-hydrolyzing) [Oscillospiraceae bacterium]MCL2278286.1 UDP-N-acetylglucosamine 2-epimerase (non-hydrolyzing) [Oscillospiraceae bacterium]